MHSQISGAYLGYIVYYQKTAVDTLLNNKYDRRETDIDYIVVLAAPPTGSELFKINFANYLRGTSLLVFNIYDNMPEVYTRNLP